MSDDDRTSPNNNQLAVSHSPGLMSQELLLLPHIAKWCIPAVRLSSRPHISKYYKFWSFGWLVIMHFQMLRRTPKGKKLENVTKYNTSFTLLHSEINIFKKWKLKNLRKNAKKNSSTFLHSQKISKARILKHFINKRNILIPHSKNTPSR